MSQPYIGEIRITPFHFAPAGWLSCDGQLLSIEEYETLFNLIGTTYGGDGQSTFAVPNLMSRIPVHQSANYVIGQTAGAETITLATSQIPTHTHAASCSSAAGTNNSPANALWAASPVAAYSNSASPTRASLSPSAISASGEYQPHENRMPYQTVNYIISLFGIFPQQS